MANYIKGEVKGEVLCEGYTYFDIDHLGDQEKAELKQNLIAFMSERASFMLGSDVSIDVEFEDGSLKTWVKIIGFAGTILTSSIAGYPTFRDGVKVLTRDVTTLAQSANLEMIFRTKAAYCERISVESRKGVFGRVDALLSELDSVQRSIQDTRLPTHAKALDHFRSVTDELVEWNRKVEKLFTKFTTHETAACVSAGLLEEFERFPTEPPWKESLNGNGIRNHALSADPQLQADVHAAVTRFERLVASIKKLMTDRVQQYAPATS